MVLFKDLTKESSDLLTRDFPYDKAWDVEVKYKGGNAQFINCASATAAASVDAASTIKFNSHGVNTEVKVTPNGGALCDIGCSLSKYVDGLTLGSRFERKSSGKSVPSDIVDLSCEYETPRVHTRTQFNPLAATFLSSACITCNSPDNVRVGGEVSGGVDMSALKYAVGTSYTKMITTDKLWTVGLKSTGDLDGGLDKVICNVHTSSSGGSSNKSVVGPAEVGVEVKHSARDGKTGLTFGGLWFLDEEKKTSVKAKIAHNASLGMAVSHAFTPAVTGVLGMQVDTLKMSSADSVKYGIKMYCKA
eukprot:GHVS01060398.1.p1 GENE.GHVS01060398.1~~GHVS01060398.1.p1  ORF type:complete len:304 (-),score=52.09 GHVS01060398.1:442-1353(-)